MSESPIRLEQLAIEANAWLDRAKVAEDGACDLRISAGELLAEAKDRVRAGEPGHSNWPKWVRENIKHSYHDANQCIAIAHRTMAMARCIAIVQSTDSKPALDAGRERARAGTASSRARAGETFDPDPQQLSVIPAASGDPPVTIDTVKRDIQLLSAKDRAALAEWLMPDSEVQRDRYGHAIDPLAVRLRRVLHRLTKETNRKPSKDEQHIYNELSLLARSQISDHHHSRIISLQFAISQLVSDLTGGDLSQSTFSEASENYQNGVRELEGIVTELSRTPYSLTQGGQIAIWYTPE
jgi:hypothetical protein